MVPVFNKTLLAAVILLIAAKTSFAANSGDILSFSVDENFDAVARTQVQSVLVKTSPNIYFFFEKEWWNSQTGARQEEILAKMDGLSVEFDNRIYPVLTSVFGQEWKPGIDGDPKITILFHAMKDGVAGYFRSVDEYVKIQSPDSNEKEMLYLPIAEIDSFRLKNFLAHELVHLITFNQKEKISGVQEDIWLNEARAEYASTILGYDSAYEGSNLQKRVKDFLGLPSDSLVEWQETKYDYGSANLFTQYLVDHYGISILTDSLKSKFAGIEAVNEALAKNGYKEKFPQIFTDWTIALAVNDCSLDSKYCYLSQNLKNIKINPPLNFLPLMGDSSLSVTNITKNWAGGWQKIIGGNGDLVFEFSSLPGLNFRVPYILAGKNGGQEVKFLEIDYKKQSGKIEIKGFGENYSSLTLIPSLQTKTAGFNGMEFTYPYTFSVAISGTAVQESQSLIQKLLAQIESLKKQIAALQNKIMAGRLECSSFNSNLYFAVQNKKEVSCLQEFLKSQGANIYPEGLVTGNFGALTKSAVIRFQEKHKDEILKPAGLAKGTGFVGILTRSKINKIVEAGF